MMKNKFLVAVSTFIITFTAQAQVTQINSNGGLQVYFPINNVKTILVSEIDSTIWITEGTLASTTQVSATIKLEEIGQLLSGKLVFRGSTTATGSELYITDGTPGGTILVRDIYVGVNGSDPSDFTLHNGFIYFSAVTMAQGRELWRTDGTNAGTTLVKDIVTGSANSNEEDGYNLFSNGSFLLLAVNTAAEGLELWKSDGTSAGTVVLKNIYAGADSSSPKNFYALNNTILFTATDAANGEELWKTDGTAAGTVLVKDINPGPSGSLSVEFFPGFSVSIFEGFHTFNNKVYFAASGGTSLGELWTSDGTTANTSLVKDILPAATFSNLSISNSVNLPGKFIFSVADYSTSAAELWQSDGSPAGTTLFKSYSGENNNFPYILQNYLYDPNTGTFTNPLFQGNKFFFIASTSTQGNELWISDGTLANTNIVKDIWPGVEDAFIFPSYNFTDTVLYFSANEGVKGNELWKTNGTTAGTVLVADINIGAGDSEPLLPFFSTNNKIIFNANNGDAIENDLYVIGGNIVPPANPCPGGNFSITSNISGAAYQWQVNTGGGFVNVANNATYAGANTQTLQLNNAPSSFYGYQYRCNVSGNFSTVTTLKFVNNWRGTASNLWNNPANWSCGVLPDGNTDVVISTGTCVLNVNGTCRSIAVSPAANFTINTGFNLVVTR